MGLFDALGGGGPSKGPAFKFLTEQRQKDFQQYGLGKNIWEDYFNKLSPKQTIKDIERLGRNRKGANTQRLIGSGLGSSTTLTNLDRSVDEDTADQIGRARQQSALASNPAQYIQFLMSQHPGANPTTLIPYMFSGQESGAGGLLGKLIPQLTSGLFGGPKSFLDLLTGGGIAGAAGG